MVICLERDADLHIAQLMLLPLTVSCSSKIQIGFTFLVLAHPGSPGQRAVKRVCALCVFTGPVGGRVDGGAVVDQVRDDTRRRRRRPGRLLQVEVRRSGTVRVRAGLASSRARERRHHQRRVPARTAHVHVVGRRRTRGGRRQVPGRLEVLRRPLAVVDVVANLFRHLRALHSSHSYTHKHILC